MTGEILRRDIELQAKNTSEALAKAEAYRFALAEDIKRLKYEIEVLTNSTMDPDVTAVIVCLETKLRRQQNELESFEHDVVGPIEERRFLVDARRRRFHKLQAMFAR